MASVGRNDPCPCGSGKKFKKCCSQVVEASALPPELQRTLAWHQLDTNLGTDLYAWVSRAFPEWISRAHSLFLKATTPGLEEPINLVEHYLFWHFHPDGSGGTVADRYFEQHPERLGAHADLLDCHRRSWLGLWEVRHVNPGHGFQMMELLTREERYIHEREGSRSWKVYDTCLSRVAELGQGLCVLAGTNPCTLPPRPAERLRKEFLQFFFPRRRKLKPAELRTDENFIDLCNFWTRTLDGWYSRPLPTLLNHDGDPMEWCTDEFAFSPDARPALLACLRTLGPVEENEGEARLTLSRPALAHQGAFETITLGTLSVGADRCRAKTNSLKRADYLCAQLLASSGSLLRHLGRQRKEVKPPREGSFTVSPGQTPVPQEVLDEALRQLRQKHMNEWLDRPVPLLSGQTPRQADANPRSRGELELLLKEFAFREARASDSQRISLDLLYQELGFGK